MARKAIQVKDSLPEQGEVITKTTTETITREPKANEPDDKDEDFLFVEEEDEDELSPLELFLRQIGESEENVKIVVWRLPDAHSKGMFRQENLAFAYKGTFPLEPGMTPEDVYDTTRENYQSGGRYRFQIRSGQKFGKSWEQVISDPSNASEAQLQPQQSTPDQAEHTKNEVESAFDLLDRMLSMNQRLTPQQSPAMISQPTQTETLDTALDMIDKVTSISERLTPKQTAATDSIGVIGQVAMLADALGLKDIIKPFGTILAAQIAQSMQQAQAKQQAQEQAKLKAVLMRKQLAGNSNLNDANSSDVVEPSHSGEEQTQTPAFNSTNATVNFQQTPAEVPDEDDSPFNFQSFFREAAVSLARDEPVEDTAEDCIALMSDMGYAIALQGMLLEQPVTDELITALSGLCEHDLTQYLHAKTWIENLQQATKQKLIERANVGNGQSTDS